jgi:multiple sugar transport system substrate-binding protein
LHTLLPIPVVALYRGRGFLMRRRVSRRDFLKMTGAGLADASLLGTAGCGGGAGEGAYQVVYADPYQIMAPYHEALADLNGFDSDDNLPSIPKGTDDFIPTQLAAAGRFENEENLYALPYDCPTMIWMYRTDLFEKYGERMSQDLGFDPTPSPELTWEQYYQIANWFNENQDEVPYGTGHQARQYDSLMCDFSNILWSYGGDYFNETKVGSLGTAYPGPCTLDEQEPLEAAEFYKKLCLSAQTRVENLAARPSGVA